MLRVPSRVGLSKGVATRGGYVQKLAELKARPRREGQKEVSPPRNELALQRPALLNSRGVAASALVYPRVQTPVEITPDHDLLEREADAGAALVPDEAADASVSRRIPLTPTWGLDTTTAIRGATEGGIPLEPETRALFERPFGHDFSQVRIHADDAANAAARAVQARAYTYRNHILLKGREYTPGTARGQRLLAHELAHVVQQGGAAPLHPEPDDWTTQAPPELLTAAVPPAISARISPRIARLPEDEPSVGSTVGYVAVYLDKASGGMDPVIDFHTQRGMFRYHLDDVGDFEPGEYRAHVRVRGQNVEFRFDVAKGQLFSFRYRVMPGQANPATFFAKQSVVTFTVVADQAPPLASDVGSGQERNEAQDVAAALDESEHRAAEGDTTGMKIFPFRGTRLGGAPLTVFRDGSYIRVKSYVYVLGNPDFREQTRTLPLVTFVGGVLLRPDEIVRVHTYEPRWYHLNITGSTRGDIENEFSVTGEQMLKIGEISNRATLLNIGLTVVDALTLILPVGKLVTVAMRGGRVAVTAMMLGLRDVAPTALAGIASRGVSVLVEEQVVDKMASRAISQTVNYALIEFSERSAEQVTEHAVAGATIRSGIGATTQAGTAALARTAGRTVTVTAVDAGGRSVVSSVTTPTGDAALDEAIDRAWEKTFSQPTPQAATTVSQGVVKAAPEIAAGFTQQQVVAFRRILARPFTQEDIKVLGQLWSTAARPGDSAILTASNSRYLFDLHRNRFWSLVRANPPAQKLFTDAGCQFSGGAPYYLLGGNRITLTIDHIIERQTAPQLALTASNLRLAFSRENSVVLRLINQLDPFQR